MKQINTLIALAVVLLGLALIWKSQNPKSLPEISFSMPAPAQATSESRVSAAPAVLPLQERNLSEWLNQLPTSANLSELSDDEVHGTPAIVTHAADELTAYAEMVRNTPSLRTEALGFFKACAEKDAVVDALRAYCFAKAVTLQLELSGQVWDPQSVPANIKTLSTQL